MTMRDLDLFMEIQAIRKNPFIPGNVKRWEFPGRAGGLPR